MVRMASARVFPEAPRRSVTHTRYVLESQLAAGGMGVIYRAFDQLGRREVAYKRMRAGRDGARRAQLSALFQREFDALARLPHPNIVEVYEYGFDEDGPYYTMELLAGADLTTRTGLPYREVCGILRDVASALALVHARGCIHRDVSPRNVRLTPDGRAKLIDFGGLMAFGRPEELVGTAAFIAPECLRESPLDQRVDLYALGAVAYWALTGRLAVQARRIEDLVHAWLDPPAAPSAYAPQIPRELDALVLSLLQEDPVARPSSAAYVIDQLTAIADLPPERDELRVAYSYLKQPPLVGRDELIEELQAAVQSALDGEGRALVLEGGPGLGRSALLDQVELYAQLAGATVLRGEGVPASAPFTLARQLLELALGLAPELENVLPGLAAVLPQALEPRVHSAVEAAERRARSLEVVQAGLLQLSQQHPLIVLVDDTHWVDPESLALLAALTQALPERPFALITTAASGNAPTDPHAQRRLEAGSRRFTLAPLVEHEVVALVHGIFGGVPNCHRVGLWLYAQSGGHPGPCLDMMRLLLQRGVIRYTVGTFTLPHDVSQPVGVEDRASARLARLADLPESARATSAALSLHDGALSAEQLARVISIPAHQVLHALEELEQRGAVMRVPAGFVLASEPMRELLAHTLAPEQARAWHARLADALLAPPNATLDVQLAAALQLLKAGQEDAAAALVKPISRHMVQLAASAGRAMTVLEALLASYRQKGRSDEECLGFLVPLLALGYFGDIDVQRRYLDRTLPLLFRQSGLALAQRLRPWLGSRAALTIGLSVAAVRTRFMPKARRFGSLRELLTAFTTLVMSAVAACTALFESARTPQLLAFLEPFAALPAHRGAALLRESCRATAELGAGMFKSAAARYARVRELAAKPIRGLDANAHRALYLGVLNGEAQAEVANCSPHALELADQLERETMFFFAAHAECTRMTYYSQRGEIDRAEAHRQRAELLALRGGTSWSMVTVLAARWAYAAIQTRDAIRLVQAIAELTRLTALAPNLSTLKALCEAWLEYLRGHVERSVACYEEVIDTDVARQLPTWRIDRILFATVLNAAGQHARAKALCLALPVEGELATALHSAQLALAEAGLGDFASAAQRLDALLVELARADNPLALGNAHRDRAYVALLAGDRPGFDGHFAAMGEAFRRTQNPSLIQQCDGLLSEAVRRGLRSSGRPSQASAAIAGELDGSTVVESNPGKTAGRPYTAES